MLGTLAKGLLLFRSLVDQPIEFVAKRLVSRGVRRLEPEEVLVIEAVKAKPEHPVL